MEPFRPIEANNNGQMVPQAESIWEGNYTNAAVARNAKRMLTTETGWKEHFTTSTSCARFAELLHKKASFSWRRSGWLNVLMSGSERVQWKCTRWYPRKKKKKGGWKEYSTEAVLQSMLKLCRGTTSVFRENHVNSRTSTFHELRQHTYF